MRFPFFARLALLFCLAAPALAQVSEAEADRRVAALAEELKSPFCPGKTLMTCTSNQAYTLRKEMHEMVLRGLSNDEVIAELKLRYGDEVENPPQPWYTFFVPLMPYLLGVLVVILVGWYWLRRGKAEAPATPAAPEASEDVERLARLRARVAAVDDE